MTGLRSSSNPAALAALLVAVVAIARADTVADIAGDWKPPNGDTAVGGTNRGWTYLRSDAPVGATETNLVPSPNTGDVGGIGFAGDSGTGRRVPAVVGDNTNGGDYELFNDGDANAAIVGADLLVHPDSVFPESEFVIASYTISAADVAGGGWATVEGSFRNLVQDPGGLGTSVAVSVYRNETRLFWYVPSLVNVLGQADGAFRVGTAVAEGDSIRFVVGANGARFGDETAIRATIDVEAAPAVLPVRGTIGTQIVVDGAKFGDRPPKVTLQQPGARRRVALRVLSNTESQLTCLLRSAKRLGGAGTFEMHVKPKGMPRSVAGTFTIALPRIAAVTPATLAPGDEILIEGEHFGSKTGRVEIGGRKARVLEWSDAAIRCRVHPKATPGVQDVEIRTKAATGTTAMGRVLLAAP